MQEHKQPSLMADMKGLFALIQWWAQIHAFPCEAFLRKFGTWGDRYAGLPALFALFYIPVFCVLLPIPRPIEIPDSKPAAQGSPFAPYSAESFQDAGPTLKVVNAHAWGYLGASGVWMFWSAYAVALLIHRVKGIQLRTQGYECHSRFTGLYRFGRLEMAVCGCMGIVLIPLCVPVGIYFLAGTLALSINEEVMGLRDRARVRALTDARIEAAYYADLARKEEEEG